MILIQYSDLHIRPERLEDCEKVLEAVFQIAMAYRKKGQNVRIINGGDTFNTRGLLRTVCFDRLYWHYKRWFDNGLIQYIIVGNHDQEDKAGEIHPMRVFKEFAGWEVIDRPMVVENMAFFPYIEKHHVQKCIEGVVCQMKPTKKPLAFVHWGFIGAHRNDTNIDKDGIPVEWVKDFSRVFSGHYHYRNAIANVQYIGSPLQQNFGEMGQDKGVLVYDTKADKMEFVAITTTPKHYEVKVSWEDGKEKYDGPIKEIREIDFVRVVASGDVETVGNYSREKAYKKLKAAEIKIDRQIKEKHFSRLKIEAAEKLDMATLMDKYVSFIETGLDKKKLMKIGARLIGGMT